MSVKKMAFQIKEGSGILDVVEDVANIIEDDGECSRLIVEEDEEEKGKEESVEEILNEESFESGDDEEEEYDEEHGSRVENNDELFEGEEVFDEEEEEEEESYRIDARKSQSDRPEEEDEDIVGNNQKPNEHKNLKVNEDKMEGYDDDDDGGDGSGDGVYDRGELISKNKIDDQSEEITNRLIKLIYEEKTLNSSIERDKKNDTHVSNINEKMISNNENGGDNIVTLNNGKSFSPYSNYNKDDKTNDDNNNNNNNNGNANAMYDDDDDHHDIIIDYRKKSISSSESEDFISHLINGNTDNIDNKYTKTTNDNILLSTDKFPTNSANDIDSSFSNVLEQNKTTEKEVNKEVFSFEEAEHDFVHEYEGNGSFHAEYTNSNTKYFDNDENEDPTACLNDDYFICNNTKTNTVIKDLTCNELNASIDDEKVEEIQRKRKNEAFHDSISRSMSGSSRRTNSYYNKKTCEKKPSSVRTRLSYSNESDDNRNWNRYYRKRRDCRHEYDEQYDNDFNYHYEYYKNSRNKNSRSRSKSRIVCGRNSRSSNRKRVRESKINRRRRRRSLTRNTSSNSRSSTSIRKEEIREGREEVQLEIEVV